MDTTKKHGGKRKGAGRPQLHDESKVRVICISVPKKLVEQLDDRASYQSRSELITEAIRDYLARS